MLGCQEDTANYDQAAAILDKISRPPKHPAFLALPPYKAMA